MDCKVSLYTYKITTRTLLSSGVNAKRITNKISQCNYLFFVNTFDSCCWISLSRYGGSWLVSTTVNLTRRLDSGRINSSPVSRSPAIVRWSEGCPSQSLRIPVEDADEDVVKCRYAAMQNTPSPTLTTIVFLMAHLMR